PNHSVRLAQRLAADMVREHPGIVRLGPSPLFRDCWTGDLRSPDAATDFTPADRNGEGDTATRAPRSARLTRRPEVREGNEREDEKSPGAWMIPPDVPHEQAEDPLGM